MRILKFFAISTATILFSVGCQKSDPATSGGGDDSPKKKAPLSETFPHTGPQIYKAYIAGTFGPQMKLGQNEAFIIEGCEQGTKGVEGDVSVYENPHVCRGYLSFTGVADGGKGSPRDLMLFYEVGGELRAKRLKRY